MTILVNWWLVIPDNRYTNYTSNYCSIYFIWWLIILVIGTYSWNRWANISYTDCYHYHSFCLCHWRCHCHVHCLMVCILWHLVCYCLSDNLYYSDLVYGNLVWLCKLLFHCLILWFTWPIPYYSYLVLSDPVLFTHFEYDIVARGLSEYCVTRDIIWILCN